LPVFSFMIIMKKYFACLFTGTLFSFSLAAQQLQVDVNYATTNPTVTKPVIYYSPFTKLTWDDFRAKPDAASDAAAITNAGIGFQMNFHSKDNLATVIITVDCNFSKNDSWVKKNKNTPYILNHEQHHFDIAYIYAMKLIHNLKVAKYTSKNYNKLIEKIYYDTQTELLGMQNNYDRETKNSQLTDQQALWDKKIDAEVDSISKQ